MGEPTRWFCTVCGEDSPEFVPAMSKRNSRNVMGRDAGVIALPCGHEQAAGLGLRSEEEQRQHRIATSPAPTGTKAYLAALANPHDGRHDRRKG